MSKLRLRERQGRTGTLYVLETDDRRAFYFGTREEAESMIARLEELLDEATQDKARRCSACGGPGPERDCWCTMRD